MHLSDNFPWDPTPHSDSATKSISSIAIEDLYNGYDYGFDDSPLLLDLLQDVFSISGVKHSIRKDIDAEKLADLWHITISNAARTLKCVDMDRIRELKGRIHRRFKTKAHQRRYKQMGGYLSYFASDTFKSNVISLRGNKYMQLFCNRANFCVSYPLKKKIE